MSTNKAGYKFIYKKQAGDLRAMKRGRLVCRNDGTGLTPLPFSFFRRTGGSRLGSPLLTATMHCNQAELPFATQQHGVRFKRVCSVMTSPHSTSSRNFAMANDTGFNALPPILTAFVIRIEKIHANLSFIILRNALNRYGMIA